jgi:hypothetical protein
MTSNSGKGGRGNYILEKAATRDYMGWDRLALLAIKNCLKKSNTKSVVGTSTAI